MFFIIFTLCLFLSKNRSNCGFGALQDHDYLETSPSTEEQLNAAQKEIARLTTENENLRIKQFCLQRIQCEPKLIMFYTGLHM